MFKVMVCFNFEAETKEEALEYLESLQENLEDLDYDYDFIKPADVAVVQWEDR